MFTIALNFIPWGYMYTCIYTVHMFEYFYLIRFFGEDPPPPPSSITWNVDKKPLALRLLSLCRVSLEEEMATPFQLCAIVTPKLVRNLDSMTGLSNKDKLSLAMDILSITQGRKITKKYIIIDVLYIPIINYNYRYVLYVCMYCEL